MDDQQLDDLLGVKRTVQPSSIGKTSSNPSRGVRGSSISDSDIDSMLGLSAPQPERSFLGNVKNLAIGGGKRLAAGMPLADDIALGRFDDKAAGRIAQGLQPEEDKPEELQQVTEAFKPYTEKWNKAEGFVDSAKVLGEMAGTIGKQVVTNPKGMAYATAEQAANMAPAMGGMYAGGKIGAAAGSLIGPGGAIAGGIIGALGGAFAGGWSTEAGLEATGYVGDELAKRGLEPTEQNVQALLQDDGVRTNVIGMARRKATGTAATDAALTLIGGRVASTPGRSAMKEAVAQLGKGASREAIEAAAKENLQGISKLSRAGYAAAGGSVDIAGEGISEAAGQKWATGELNMADIAQETAAGVGGAAPSVITAAKSMASKPGVAEGQPAPQPIIPPNSPLTRAAALLAGTAPMGMAGPVMAGPPVDRRADLAGWEAQGTAALGRNEAAINRGTVEEGTPIGGTLARDIPGAPVQLTEEGKELEKKRQEEAALKQGKLQAAAKRRQDIIDFEQGLEEGNQYPMTEQDQRKAFTALAGPETEDRRQEGEWARQSRAAGDYNLKQNVRGEVDQAAREYDAQYGDDFERALIDGGTATEPMTLEEKRAARSQFPATAGPITTTKDRAQEPNPRQAEIDAFNREFEDPLDNPEARKSLMGKSMATDETGRRAEWLRQEKTALAQNKARNFAGAQGQAVSINEQVDAQRATKAEAEARKKDPLYDAKKKFNESLEAQGTIPQVEYPSDQDAAAFEKKVRGQQSAKQFREWSDAHNKKTAANKATLEDESIPEEVRKAAVKEADDIVSADPVYSHMAEAKKRGKLNLEAFGQDYDRDTIRQITRRYPGIFSLVGTVKPDEFADEMGYANLDDMVRRFSEARTKTELAAQIVRERSDQYQQAEGERKAAEAKTQRTKDVKEWSGPKYADRPDRVKFPAAAEEIDFMENLVRLHPDRFTDEDLDHWTYTAEQQDRLKKALRDAKGEGDGREHNGGNQENEQVPNTQNAAGPVDGGAEQAGVADDIDQDDRRHGGAVSVEGAGQAEADKPEKDVVPPVDEAATEAASSPANDLDEPTDAQKEAGNYKKGHVTVYGLGISIENPAGSVRSGTDSDGERWQVEMSDHYGYIKGTEGKDKDHLDVFIPEGFVPGDGDLVGVIDQVDPETGKFDEHKLVFGAMDEAEARATYLRNYDATGATRIGALTMMPVDEFKAWLESGNTKKPAGGISASKTAENETQTDLPVTGEEQAKNGELDGTPGTAGASDKTEQNKQGSHKSDGAPDGELSLEEELAATSDEDLASMLDDVFGDKPTAAPKTPAKPMMTPLEKFRSDMENKGAAGDAKGKGFKIVASPTDDGSFVLEIVDEEGHRSTIGRPYPPGRGFSRAEVVDLAVEKADFEKPARAPRTTTKADPPGAGTVTGPSPTASPAKTGRKIAKEGGLAALGGVKSAMAGLNALFGGKNRLGSGLSFDEETYAKAKPHFVEAWNDAKQAGYSLKELIQYFHDQFGKAIRSYLERFLADVKAGDLTIDQEATTVNQGDTEQANQTEDENDNDTAGSIQADGESIRDADQADNESDDSAPEGVATEGVSAPGSGEKNPDQGRKGGKAGAKGPKGGKGKRPSIRGGAGATAEGIHPPATGEGSAGRDGKGVIPAQNFRITEDVQLGEGGEAQKYRDNVAAIRTLKTLMVEGRRATPEEQRILARYVGWGGLANAFRNQVTGAVAEKWADRVAEIEELLSPAELKHARSSTRNAHYTSKAVVDAMYQALAHLGYTGGLALEPSSGTGNFIGLMPEDMAKATNFIGIEFDNITAGIAKHLYPQSAIFHSGFQDVPLPKGAFDLVIGNPPFGKDKLIFRSMPHLNSYTIHNQFFLASLEALRPGGIQAMVVSRFFLDSQESNVRELIDAKAKFLGAIRLPVTAFKENARTEVITDIVFLQKRTAAEQAVWDNPEARAGRDLSETRWLRTADVADPLGGEPIRVNSYFASTPNAIMGSLERSGSMRRANDVNVTVPKGADLGAMITKAAKELLPAGVFHQQTQADRNKEHFEKIAKSIDLTLKGAEDGSVIRQDDGKLLHTFYQESEGGTDLFTSRELSPESPWHQSLTMDKDGNWYREIDAVDEKGEKIKQADSSGKTLRKNVKAHEVFKEGELPKRMTLGKDNFKRLGDAVDLLGILKKQISLESNPESKERDVEANRKKLKQAYDGFVKAHGYLNSQSISTLISEMPDSALLFSLETKYEKPVTKDAAKKTGMEARPAIVKPATILTSRAIPLYQTPESFSNPTDALGYVLSDSGKVDINQVADLYGKSVDETVKDLQAGEEPLIFENPETGQYETADEYLSGNLARKLEAAKMRDDLQLNIEALEKSMPEPWGSDKVTVVMGATWFPPTVYSDFLTHLTGGEAKVTYQQATNTFFTSGSTNNPKAEQWRSGNRDAVSLVDSLINRKTIRVTSRNADGNFVFDEVATEEANNMAENIKNEFDSWVMRDSDRRQLLTDLYNKKYNIRVNSQRNGQHLLFPGKVPDSIISMRRHQKNGVWRGIIDRFVLYDHAVGAGKTFTGIARAIERKRMGLSRKPMIVVPNHLVNQFASDVYRLYPGARLMALGKKDLEPKKRRRAFAKIATGDWDIVIVPHSSFQFIGIAPETEARFIQDELDVALEVYNDAVAEAMDDGWNPASKRPKPLPVKEAEALVEKLQAKMAAVANRSGSKDRLLTFEQMGIDDLTIDEAHEFKNLFYSSSLTNVRGMNPKTGSGKAYDLWTKVRVLREQANGSVAFMTGTPISNSAVEMYVLMRYLGHDMLADGDMEHFDSWYSQFVPITTKREPTDTGRGLKEVTRMGRDWSNMRNMMGMYYTFADCVTNEDIAEWYAQDNGGKKFPIPEVKGGGRKAVEIKPTEMQSQMLEQIIEDFDNLDSIEDIRERNSMRLRLMDAARKVSLDVRAVNPLIQTEEKGGKLDVMAGKIAEIHKRTNAVRGTQLVFLDRGVPKSKGDDKIIKEYDDLVKKLNDAEEAGDDNAARKVQDSLERFNPNEIAELKAAQAGGWNAYQQLKDNLIAQGVPANEIRFVQEANTDDQKAALFEEVRGGKVRILIGSTPRMGAGTNVQDRLVALHHGDVTWKPSDIEQREGRIIRQGNLFATPATEETPNPLYDPNFEVEINAYVTETTVDSKLWTLNATKLKMINGIRKYAGEFNMEFDDEDSVSMAEIAAIASGEPLQLERIQLAGDIEKLIRQKRAHENRIWSIDDKLTRARREIKDLPDKVKALEQIAPTIKEAAARINEQGDSRSVDINGSRFSVYRKTAALEMIDAIRKQASEEKTKFAVTIDGKEFKSADKAEVAVHSKLGDEQLVEIKTDTETHIRRIEFTREFAAKANEAIAKAIEAGRMSNDGEIDGVEIMKFRLNGVQVSASVDINQETERKTKQKLLVADFRLEISLGPGNTETSFYSQDITPEKWALPGEEGAARIKIRPSMPALLSDSERTIAGAIPRLDRYREDLEKAQKMIPEYERLAQEEFQKQGELDKKQDRLAEVERELASRAPTNNRAARAQNNDAQLSVARGIVPEEERADIEAELRDGIGSQIRTRRLMKLVTILDDQAAAASVAGGKGVAVKSSEGGAIQGIYANGHIYLVRDGIEKGRAMAIVLHELGEHAQHLGFANDQEYRDILTSLERRKDVAGKTGDAIRAAMEKAKAAGAKPEHFWSEVAAYIVEANANVEIGLLGRIVNFFKRLLFRAGGISADAFTPADLVLFARAAVRAATSAPSGPGGGKKFSVQTPQFSERRVFQAISSAATSLDQIAAIFKKGLLKPGTVNVDIGGGKFDKGTEHLNGLGVENLVFDPFNRTKEHNDKVTTRLSQGPVDTATVNNVLNVIKEPEIRSAVVRQAAKAIKPDGTAYFQIHEGDADGNSRVTKIKDGVPASWQNHQRTQWYMQEVGDYFGDVSKKGNIIIAKSPKKDASMAAWIDQDGSPMFSRAIPQTATQTFKKWFGQSKITKNGQPHVLYHGTAHPQFLKDGEYPWIFDQRRPRNAGNSNLSGLGIFLGGMNAAEAHAGPAGTTHPFFVRIQNPYITTAAELEKKVEASGADVFRKRLQDLSGHDGIIITDRGHAIAFDANQVKSATDNTGAFSDQNDDVRFSKRAAPTATKAEMDQARREALGEERSAVIERMTEGGFTAELEGKYFKTMAREGENVVDVADASIGTKASDWFKSLPRAAARKALGALTLGQLRDVFGRKIPQMVEFFNATREIDADAKRIMTRADEVYNQWAALPRAQAKAMSELMIKATIAGVNPDADFESRANLGNLRKAIDQRAARIAEIDGELAAAGDRDKLEAEKNRLQQAIKKSADRIENEGKRFRDYQELKPMYAKLGKDAKAVYQAVKKQYVDNLNDLFKALESRLERQIKDPRLRNDTMNAIRLKYDKYLEDGPYFPLSRFGDYLTIAEKDGRREVRTFDSLAERTRYTRTRRAEGWDVQAKTKREYSREAAGASSHFVEQIFGIIDKAEGLPGSEAEQLKDQVNQAFIKALPDLSHRKHFAHRQKVEGYSRDQMRAFADNMQHAAHHIARIRHSDKMETAIESILKESQMLDKNQNGDDYTDLYNELNARMKIMNNPDISPATQAITAAGFVMNIGPSIASALVNLTQTPLVAFPILSTRFKKTGSISAMNALSRASADYFSSKPSADIGPDLLANKKLKQEERDMISTLIDDGTIDVTGAHSLAQAAGNDFFNLARTKHGHNALKVMRLVSYPFHVAELANRKVTALAAYRLALKNGMSHADAVNETREIVLDSHFDFSQANRARWMEGNVRRVLFLFKQYSQQMTWLLGRSFYLAAKGETKDVKDAARKRLAMIIGGHFLVAGINGLPVLGAAMAVSQFFAGAFGDDDDPPDIETSLRNTLADALGKEGGEAMYSGPWRMLPWLGDLDISSRVSLGDLWFRAPSKEAEGRDKWNQYVNLLLGPVATNGMNLFAGAQTMAEGHLWRGVETMLPKAIKDGMKAVRYTREGVKNWQDDTLIDNLDTVELFAQALGFTPSRVSEMYAGANAIKNHESKIDRRRQMLVNRWVQATRRGDAETSRQVMEEIGAFNQKQPVYAIKGQSLRQSYQQRLKVQSQTKDGVFVPAKKNEIREFGRFANI